MGQIRDNFLLPGAVFLTEVRGYFVGRAPIEVRSDTFWLDPSPPFLDKESAPPEERADRADIFAS